MRIAYYVNSHGYGHAKRSAAIILELLRQNKNVLVEIRTNAPTSFFPKNDRISIGKVSDDLFIEEVDGLKIDVPGTVAGLLTFMENYESILRNEVEGIQKRQLSGIVSDISFVAGDVAARIGAPCVAVANFTWDWIWECELGKSHSGLKALNTIRSAYQKMGLLLQVREFSHNMERTFAPATKIIETPMTVCHRNHACLSDSRRHLSEALNTDVGAFERGIVYCDIRKLTIPLESFQSVSKAFPNVLFLIRNSKASTGLLSKNLANVPSEITYDDAFNACSVVVNKLGYCAVTSAIHGAKRMVFPTREGFREDELLRDVTHHIPTIEITRDALVGGTWLRELDRVLSLPLGCAGAESNGAEVSAKEILDFFSKK